MSVQKLVGEADKLLEKGKYPEGIAKLKSAIALEPLNQIVVTKLAGIMVQNKEPLEAAKVYAGLGKRLSDAGKSQVAIAIFKQALELSPDDITLRMRYAQECESAGKLGDAFLQGQIVLNFYLRRKRYFDASNILPLMVRAQPKDDKIKAAWVEVLQYCQAEQKLIHLLVALCGPPGLSSQEFPQGGDPAGLPASIYESMKKLVPYFPRDPKIAYAMAWCGYRRGQMRDFYHYLRECLRREPDFCLGILLFARVLAEGKKLNESLFVYKYFKERMIADKNADMLSLNRLMESFVEKNGWIKFIEDSGEMLDTAGFFGALTGEQARAREIAEVEKEKEKTSEIERERTRSLELPPAEIELGGGPVSADMEILLTTGQSIHEAKTKKPSGAKGESSMRIQAELIKATVEAAVAGMSGAPASAPQTVVQPVILPAIQAGAHGLSPEMMAGVKAATGASRTSEEEGGTGVVEGFNGESVEFTSLIRTDGNGKLTAEQPKTAAPAEADSGVTRVSPAVDEDDKTGIAPSAESGDRTTVQPLTAEPAAEAADVPEEGVALAVGGDEEPEVPSKKKGFNPFEQAAAGNLPGSAYDGAPGVGEKTEMFSPMELLDAAKVMHNREIDDVATKMISLDEAAKAPALDVSPPSEHDQWLKLKVEGDQTVPFSPVEAVQAGVDSRRPMENPVRPTGSPPIPPSVPVPSVTPPLPSAPAIVPEDGTVVMSGAAPSEAPAEATMVLATGAGAVVADDGTAVMTKPIKTDKIDVDPNAAEAGKSREVSAPPAEARGESVVPSDPRHEPTPPPEAAVPAPAPASAAEGPAFMLIPPAAIAAKAGAEKDDVDMGSDLLEGPTRIFTQPTAADQTEHLIKEIKQDLKKKSSAGVNIEMLLKQAERYTAKRNYYLARKALRHAQALGAAEEVVKIRLREIRKLELPDGLYNTFSSDQSESKVDTADVLLRLEEEFDLTSQDGADQLGRVIEGKVEAIFREADARTILDFGVGLHEMGLFRQAEALFIRLVEEFPDHAFDAYYLAATSKLARRDYAGAASILKRLSSDAAKSDQEKIQIYYALGETFEKMRQRDRSRQFFKKVAELDANYRNIRNKLED